MTDAAPADGNEPHPLANLTARIVAAAAGDADTSSISDTAATRGDIVEWTRSRFGDTPEWTRLHGTPDRPHLIDALARVIDAELDTDPASRYALSALVAPTKPTISVAGDVTADHGGVAIAGNNNGPITINPPTPQRWTPSDGPKRVGSFPPKPTIWVDRQEQDDIADAFGNGARIVVVHGGRGYGKTSLAAAYAAAAPADLTIWVDARTTHHAITGLASAARTLGWTTYQDSGHTATATRDELASLTTKTLLILDNAEDSTNLIQWIPAGNCQILITTTDHTFTQHGAPVPIGTYTHDQAITYLEEVTRLNDLEGAAHLADTLGNHPLALALAAAVTTTRHWTYQSYLNMHSSEPLSVSLPQGTLANYPDGYVNALALSLHAAIDATPSAHPVLALLAVLDTPISRRFLSQLLQRVNNPTSPTTTDAVVATLATTSLITLNPTHITTHRLIPRALRDTLASDPTAYQQALTATAHALTQSAISNNLATTPIDLSEEIGNHATTLLAHAIHGPSNTTNPADIATELLKICEFLYRAGAFHALSTLTEATTAILENRNETHPDTLSSRNLLATSHAALGHRDEAIRLHERNLATASKARPLRYDILLQIQTNLALAYHAADRLAEALALYQDTLDTAQRERPEDQQLHDQIMSNMAGAYRSAHQPELALPLFTLVLRNRERQLGPGALDTVRARSNLAGTRLELGDYHEALDEFQIVLPLWEDLLPSNHPDVLLTRVNVARCHLELGNAGAALTLLEGTVEQLQRQLPDHENTWQAIRLHALAYQAKQRFQEAIPLWETAVAIMQRTLPHDHPETATSRINLEIARRKAEEDS